MLRIAITGIGGGVGMAVLRSLKEYRVETEIIGLDMAAYAPGLYYAKRGYLVPSAGDPRYRERVLDVCKTERINVLIAGTDPELIPLASMNDELASLGCIPICASAEVA